MQDHEYTQLAVRIGLVAADRVSAIAAQAQALREKRQQPVTVRELLLGQGDLSPEQDAHLLRMLQAAAAAPPRAPTAHETVADPTTAGRSISMSELAYATGTLPTAPRAGPAPMRYRITRVIGRGGMGEVVLGTDADLRRDVAIKTLHVPGDPIKRARFVDEAQVTGQLEHPGVVPVHELGLDDAKRPFIVMKRVRGMSLAEVIEHIRDGRPAALDDVLAPQELPGTVDASTAAGGTTRHGRTGSRRLRSKRTRLRQSVGSRLDDDTAGARSPGGRVGSDTDVSIRVPRDPTRLRNALLAVFGKVCDAVAYAHSRGVIHRDIKPENIMIGRFGEVLVMDWGLAKVIGPIDEATVTTLSAGGDPGEGSTVITDRVAEGTASGTDGGVMQTVDGTIAGTPMFMPPEQARGEVDRLDERSDIYSLGALLYMLLTLSQPFDADNVYTLLAKVEQGDIARPQQRSRAPWSIDRELEAIVLKAMEHSPGRRYQTVGDLKADLEGHSAHLPILALKDSAWRRAGKWARRHPAAVLTIGLVLLFATVLGATASVLLVETARANHELLLAEQKAKRQEQRAAEQAQLAREQELLRLAQEGEFDRVIQALGGEITAARDKACDEFQRLYAAAQDAGTSDAVFVADLGPDRVDAFLVAYENLFLAHREVPDRVPVTAIDYFYSGVLKQMGRQDFADAIEDYTRAIELNDELDEVWLNRGSAHVQLARLDDAIADFSRAIAINSRLAMAYNNRGMVYKRKRRYEDALADYDEAIRLDDTNGGFFTNRGTLKFITGDRLGALADMNLAVDASPNYPIVFFNRAQIHRALGNHELALDDLVEACRIDRNYVEAFRLHAELLLELDRFDEAIVAYTQAVRIRPRYWGSYNDRGYARLLARRFEEAVEDFSLGLDLDSGNTKLLANRGYCHLELQHDEQALDDYEGALAADPDLWQAWHGRAILMARAGNREAASQSWEHALQHCPQSARAAIEEARRTYLGE